MTTQESEEVLPFKQQDNDERSRSRSRSRSRRSRSRSRRSASSRRSPDSKNKRSRSRSRRRQRRREEQDRRANLTNEALAQILRKLAERPRAASATLAAPSATQMIKGKLPSDIIFRYVKINLLHEFMSLLAC